MAAAGIIYVLLFLVLFLAFTFMPDGPPQDPAQQQIKDESMIQ